MVTRKNAKSTPKGALSAPVFHEPVFNEGQQTVDPPGFLTPHPSDEQLYKELGNRLETDVVSFEKSRMADDQVMTLDSVYADHGPELLDQLKQAGKIVLHVIGDSGATSDGKKYKDELDVADQLTEDCHTAEQGDHPVFLFHLGDVIYDFGEAQYYYDEFYDPFRNYPAPIFAIPGNHDSFITPGTPVEQQPLTTFMRNFCNTDFVITPEARSLHRTAMIQPGVYFALDAPFVRIIGLFSNSLEDPGVISSQGGKWKNVPDYQLDFLSAQLKRIREEKYAGAVLLATHHPPFSYAPKSVKGGAGGNHGSSSDMLRQIDTIGQQENVYPHAFLSGHAHNYQRYTRTVKFGNDAYDVPFIICGDGGHNVSRMVRSSKGNPAREPQFGSDVSYMEDKPAVKTGGLLLEKYDDTDYGYLRISVDAQQLQIGYHQVGAATLPQSRFDMVTVDLKTHTMVSN